jgi:very-short-patch-repair endonuclease
MSDAILRRFARDQWVRLHGTPRVTVLVGGARVRAMWQRWLEVGALEGVLVGGALDVAVPEAAARATASPATPIAIACSPAALQAWRAGRRDRLAAMVDEGVVEVPEAPSDVDELAGSASGATHERLADAPPATSVMVGAAAASPRARATAGAAGGSTAAPSASASATGARGAPGAVATSRRRRSQGIDARSAAEAALFEALEATPATAGRFELNEYLSVYFGPGAAEVDLLSREDRIALEVDGYYHFTDLDAYRRDREKDLLLQLQGFVVIRVLAEDVVKDARPAVNAVSRVLAARKAGNR